GRGGPVGGRRDGILPGGVLATECAVVSTHDRPASLDGDRVDGVVLDDSTTVVTVFERDALKGVPYGLATEVAHYGRRLLRTSLTTDAAYYGRRSLNVAVGDTLQGVPLERDPPKRFASARSNVSYANLNPCCCA